MLDIQAYENKKYPFPGIYRLRPLIAVGRFTKGLYSKSRKLFTILSIPLYLLAYPFRFWKVSKPKKFKHELGIAIIVKNEQDYIKEWLDYHLLLGFEVFYVFDNESTDGTYEVLKPYIEKGVVVYRKIKGKGRQIDAYNKVINKEKNHCKYIGFFDIDEFIKVDHNINLVNYIKNIFESDNTVGGITLNWMFFGSSNLKKKTDGLVIKKFVYHAKPDFIENIHIKSIVNPRVVMDFRNPHYAIYKKGYYAYNLSKKIVKGPFNDDFSNLEVRINHYFTKSEEEFMAKRNKGLADQARQRDIDEFEKFDRNEVFDDSMIEVANRLSDK